MGVVYCRACNMRFADSLWLEGGGKGWSTRGRDAARGVGGGGSDESGGEDELLCCGRLVCVGREEGRLLASCAYVTLHFFSFFLRVGLLTRA